MANEHVYRKVQVWIYYSHFDPASKNSSLRYLVLQTNPRRGGFWQPVTGNVDAGEDLEVAAYREVKEETGLDVSMSSNPIERVGEPFRFQKNEKNFVEQGFAMNLGRLESEPQIAIDPNEHTSYQWLTDQKALDVLYYSSNSAVLNLLLKK